LAIELEAFGDQDGKRLGVKDGESRTEYVELPTKLRLRVTATARTWGVAYWSPTAKTARRLRLGNAATMKLAEARKLARAAIHSVEQEGRDPFADRIAQRTRERAERQQRAQQRREKAEAKKRDGATLAKLCTDFIRHRRTTPGGRYGRKARPHTLARWESLLRLHIAPELGDRSPASLTKRDIIHLLQSAAAKGPTIPRDLEDFLRACWRWASDMQAVRLPEHSPFVGLPLIGAQRQARERVLTPAEIWLLWRASEDDRPAHGLRLMLLAACRVREANDLAVSELDLKRGIWNLPAARNKGGKDRSIPLSAQALAVINAQPPDKRGLIFGSEKAERTMLTLRPLMHELAQKHGIECGHWQPRDLRRTAATLMAMNGTPESTISRALGHSIRGIPSVTAVYQKHTYADEVRAAFEELGKWTAKVVQAKQPPKDD